jgi:aspartokinase/homoserine dehydrogenase 2
LQHLTIAEFLTQAHELDSYFNNALTNASKESSCIRYVARFQKQSTSDNTVKVSAKVSLEVLPLNDAFANLTPCDNIFEIKSRWYQGNSLIIRGPGAGRDVTAGGLHSDLVNICHQLANKDNKVKIKGIN